MRKYKGLKINRRQYYPDTRRSYLLNSEQPEYNMKPDFMDVDCLKVDFTKGQNRAYLDRVEDMGKISTKAQLKNDLNNDLKHIRNQEFLEKTQKRAKRALKEERTKKRKELDEVIEISVTLTRKRIEDKD